VVTALPSFNLSWSDRMGSSSGLRWGHGTVFGIVLAFIFQKKKERECRDNIATYTHNFSPLYCLLTFSIALTLCLSLCLLTRSLVRSLANSLDFSEGGTLFFIPCLRRHFSIRRRVALRLFSNVFFRFADQSSCERLALPPIS